MLPRALALHVFRRAVADASADGDLLLAQAHDPRLHWHSRHRMRKEHMLYIDAAGFMNGSPDMVRWANTLGVDAHAVTAKWIQWYGQKGLTER